MKSTTLGYIAMTVIQTLAILAYATIQNQWYAFVLGFATGYFLAIILVHITYTKYKNKSKRPTHSVREGEPPK